MNIFKMSFFQYLLVILSLLFLASCGSSGGGDDEADTTPPNVTVQVTTPTPSDSQTVTGTVEAGATVTVQVDSGGIVSATVTGSGWNCNINGLVDGANTITVRAADKAGNVKTVTATINRDATAPTVSLDAVSSPTNQSPVTLTGTMEAGATITVEVDNLATVGTVNTPTATTWNCDITFSGDNTYQITVTAEDALGNTATANRTLVYDITAPEILGLNPPIDGELDLTVTSDITVTFNETMNSLTVIGNNILLEDVTYQPSISITVDVNYDDVSKTATLTAINGGLVVSHQYRITVTTDVTDEAGNSLSQETWEFSTADPAPPQGP